jgi:hypothetical protein
MGEANESINPAALQAATRAGSSIGPGVHIKLWHALAGTTRNVGMSDEAEARTDRCASISDPGLTREVAVSNISRLSTEFSVCAHDHVSPARIGGAVWIRTVSENLSNSLYCPNTGDGGP